MRHLHAAGIITSAEEDSSFFLLHQDVVEGHQHI
jgi:hypothetical protein